MFIGHCFDSRTIVKYTTLMIFPAKEDGAAAPAGAAQGVVQTCSIQFQQEWHSVRTALMQLVGEFEGARERFLALFLEMEPGMAAPEWAKCW